MTRSFCAVALISFATLVHGQAGSCSGRPDGFVCPQHNGCLSKNCSGTKDFEWSEWITSHNLYRCMHGIPPLYWSTPIYQKISWTLFDKAILQKDDSSHLEPPFGPSAENLVKTSSPATPFQIVSHWYSEVQNCKGFPGCAPKAGKKTDAFTAMIWQGAKEIGCFRGRKNVAGCWYKGSNTSTCETPNYGGENGANQNIFQKAWPFEFCVNGFKQCQIPVPDVSGVDMTTGLVLPSSRLYDTSDVSLENAHALSGNALIGMMVAGVGFGALVAVVVARRRQTTTPEPEADDALLEE